MPKPSPYDLIQKAKRRPNADRWAELKVNAQDRTPIAAQPVAAPGPVPIPETPASTALPQFMDPPFSPPQPRHPRLDEIAQRHEQAARTASKPQPWALQKAGDRPKAAPMQNNTPAPPAPAVQEDAPAT